MWRCPKCGERHEETFDVCWNCGTSQDGTEDPDFRHDEKRAAEQESTDERSPPGFSEPVAATQEPQSASRDDHAVAAAAPALLVTTTPQVEGRRIVRYLGLVAGEAVLQPNSFRHFLAGVADLVGDRSSARESELRSARGLALAQMEQAARELGANAIVGVDLDYQTVGEQSAMLMVTVSGTAVQIE
jgi:uncharacterized protein YbjQ (UPF0145 family)